MFFRQCSLRFYLGGVVFSLLYFLSSGEQFGLETFSIEFIQEINALTDSWNAGHNFSPNTTATELSFLLDLSQSNSSYYKSLLTASETYRKPDAELVTDDAIPNNFDARDQWPQCPDIGKVLDQGACPSSYAFAVVPAFSDRRCILSNGKHKDPLSIEYLLSCCHACKYKDTSRECGAGQAITAWWFMHKRGIVTGGAYGSRQGCQPVSFPPCQREFSSEGSSCKGQTTPLLRCHTRCTNEYYEVPYSQDRHRGKIQYYVNTKESSIQREILTHGPATAQITVYEDFLHYKSGVYKHVTGKRFPHQHTLKLIGWGTENGSPYWLLVNSWGAQWGDKGSIKILRGQGSGTNLEYYVTASIPKTES